MGIYFTWRRQPPEEARPIASGRPQERLGQVWRVAAFFGIFAIVGGSDVLLPERPADCPDDRRRVVGRDAVQGAAGRGPRVTTATTGTTYSVYILYEYEFGGQTYKSDRYDFIGGSSSGYEGKARVVAAYESAERPVCYVNPTNPSESVLKRGFHAKLLLALFPLPFLLVGVVGIVGTLRAQTTSLGGDRGFGTYGTDGTYGACRCWPTGSASRTVLRG